MDAGDIAPGHHPAVGTVAPDFAASTVEPDGTVSLAEYRGRSPVMLIVNRGLWCSFCRRHLAHLRTTRERLHRLGVETLAVVASELHRARLYLRHRPAHVRLAVDPALVVHQAYGLTLPPSAAKDSEDVASTLRVRVEDVAVNPTDRSELAAAIRAAGADAEQEFTLWDFIVMQRQLYAYDMSKEEQQQWTLWTRHRRLATGQFLVDRDGIVRWAKVQSGNDRPAGFGNYPSDEELVAAARTLS